MFNKTSTGMIQTTVLISPEFNDLRKQYHITLSEAVRVGISILLSEKGITEYDNNLSIVRRMLDYKKKAGEYAQKASDLEHGAPENA